jgi:hypothetical protein
VKASFGALQRDAIHALAKSALWGRLTGRLQPPRVARDTGRNQPIQADLSFLTENRRHYQPGGGTTR